MLQPLRGKILIEVLENTKMTQSGLYLSIKEEIPHRGRVISLGLPYRDKKDREFEWELKIGHIVHFKRSWDFNKVKNYILKREQIYAIEYEDKAYAISNYVIIKKCEEIPSGRIFIPSHFETEVAKQISYAEVVSVGKYNTMGIDSGDNILYYRNEGLPVRIPLREELWSLLPRAIIGKIIPRIS